MRLNVKVKGQGYHGHISSPLKMHCNELAATTSCSSRWDHYVPVGGDVSARTLQPVCSLCLVKTSLALVVSVDIIAASCGSVI